eukprot:10105035-Ditylum_brightwellii.AAC.1
MGKLAGDSLIGAVALFFPADEREEFLSSTDHVMIVWIVVDPIRDPPFRMKSVTIVSFLLITKGVNEIVIFERFQLRIAQSNTIFYHTIL